MPILSSREYTFTTTVNLDTGVVDFDAVSNATKDMLNEGSDLSAIISEHVGDELASLLSDYYGMTSAHITLTITPN